MNTSRRAGAKSPVLFSDEESDRENKLNLKPIIKSLKKLEPETNAFAVVANGSQAPGRPALPDIGAHSQKDTARRKRERADSIGDSREADRHAKRQRTESSHGLSDGSVELNDVRGDALPSASDEASDAESTSSKRSAASLRLPLLPAVLPPSRSGVGAPRLRFVPPSDFCSFAVDQSADHITIDDALAKGRELWLLEVPADVGVDVLAGLELSLDESHQQLTMPDGQSGMFLEAISSRWTHSGMDASVLLPNRKGATLLQSAPTPVGIIQIVKAIDVSKVASEHVPVSSAKAKHKKKSSHSIRPLPKGLKIRYKPIGCNGSAVGTAPVTTKGRKTKKAKSRSTD